ncbi:Acyl-CoA synthetase (AMP-forming)/AMP-acid ligase II [Yoonia tamlensis]|uniref:Acyl-CoA synthetase (AMP-forming)/AMP-acid ligase II n=1 Tax=Yoonia tamlensis TaxID=390270 RepID=A0A1I6FNR0_9RHOB|nr:AMP-binding protein [Yoonia tamlensis]SFR31504.1 Acyl-CoA synthetase (AMP-forming)/AMP-acid ligase II [Yoonia tamlensis]
MTQTQIAAQLLPQNVPSQIAKALQTHQHRTAFVDTELTLTYGQLAACIARIEPALPKTGAVAVFGKPSSIFAAAVTACVVAGRPFVHLDPAMPTDVLANILAELGIDTVLMCQPAAAGQLPQSHSYIDVAALTIDLPTVPLLPVAAPPILADAAIYIVATSGTTGRPKCIPVTQQAAYLSYEWRDAYTPYDPSQTIGIYIFAIWEMFRPLRDGARMCFPSFQELLNPADLVAFLIRYNVTEMLFTPSALEKTLQAATVEMCKDVPLQRIILNGEVVSDALVASAMQKLPRAQLWNLYSICETHDIAMTQITDTARVPGAVGVAMPDLRAVVLDDHDQECALGQPGLLHFEGPKMLGPGYVNRAEETQLRFRELVLNGRAVRLYDTGDQGYVTPDGMIHVMGRIAHMLKLRGHSIQTRELTESLGHFLGFLQGVPWIVDAGVQGKALAFYYCADVTGAAQNLEKWGLKSGENRMPAALSKALRAELPAYCVPSYLVALDAIPINPVSGKCDFKALPPVQMRSTQDTATTETRPSVIFSAQALGCAVTEIDPSQSFHDCGGDSLMAVNLVLALEQAYDRRVDFDFALNVPLDRLHDVLTQAVAAPQPSGGFDRKGILLTGVTGFLGSRVLAAAARHLPQDQVIYCLVRPKRRDALERLHEIAATHGVAPNRLVMLPAAIEDARFGLGGADYAALCANTQSVIHCAAMVNLAVDRANMEIWSKAGIANILQFCRDADADLRFSSSVAVFPDTGGRHPETATSLYESCGGYGAAKIDAEQMIAASSVRAAIVRLPSLYDLDAPNPNDIYETIVTACAKMRTVPEGLMFRMIDVHSAARFLVEIPASDGARYFNLAPDLWANPNQLPTVPVAEWLAQAPVTQAERALIASDLTVLHADARFDFGQARAAWENIADTPFASISAPDLLISRRLDQ